MKDWNEPDALTALASLPGIGPHSLRAFREQYGSFSAAARQPLADLAQLASAAQVGAWVAFDGLTDLGAHLQRVRREARRCGADLITAAHVAWPTRLSLLESEDAESEAPHLLYVKGNLGPLESRYSVAIVGSRAADPQARAQAKALAAGLADAGISVVSGGALGVDGAAHRAALDAGGHTVVVQATGIDRPYPGRNKKLFQDVVETGGAVVTEMPPGTRPEGPLFSRRNRIISGLADLVIVVAGKVDSGSMSTARHAVSQERTVCAVPGDPRRALSTGPNRLLVHGAAAVVEAADVVELLLELRGRDLDDGRAAAWLRRRRETGQGGAVATGVQVALTMGAHKLLERLEGLPRAPDSLADGTGLTGAEVAAALAELEMAGLAEKVAGGYVLAAGTGPASRRERA